MRSVTRVTPSMKWDGMDVLIIEPLEAEVMQWLAARYSVRYAPELTRDTREFRQSLYNVRALVLPSMLALDVQTLHYAPVLRAVGRVSGGAENIDLDACSRAAGVEVDAQPHRHRTGRGRIHDRRDALAAAPRAGRRLRRHAGRPRASVRARWA